MANKQLLQPTTKSIIPRRLKKEVIEGAREAGMLPHEFLLMIVRGDPIEQRRWEIVYDENGVEIINFGKNKGLSVEKVLREQPGYFGWIMNSEFPLYTKKVLTAIKLRMK